MNTRDATTAPQRAQALLRDAIAHHQAGRPVEAGRRYRRVLELIPGHPDALHLMGLAAHQIGETETGLKLIQEALARNPAAAPCHANLSQVLHEAGRHEEALAAARRALRLVPNHAGATACLAGSLIALDRFDEAREVFEKACAAAPQDPRLWSNLGSTLARLGRHGEAAEAFEKAVALAPKQAELRSNLGVALRDCGRLEAAIAAHRAAIDLDSRRADSYANLASALLEAGASGAAREALETGLDLEPGDRRCLAFLAIAAHAEGDTALRDRLLDFDGLVAERQWEAPAGWETLEAFHASLARAVLEHPSLAPEPASKSTRIGSQTRELKGAGTGPLAALEAMIRSALAGYLRRAPDTRDHHFLPAAPDDWDITIWGTVLDEGGHQLPHIHPSGWLSGVYYVRAPANAPESDPEAGWIEFGRPPDVFAHLGEMPVRRIRPEEGRMLLFPSYFYHRTLPFAGAGQRISIAFDLVPAEGGRPATTDAAGEVERAARLLEDGWLEDAEVILKRLPAGAADPGSVAALRGRIAARKGRWPEATAFFDEALAQAPEEPELLEHRGIARMNTGDLKGAARDLEKAAARAPEKVTALLHLANVRSDLADEDGARAAYSLVLERQPANPTAHYGLSTLKRFEPGDPQIALIRRALSLPLGEADKASLCFALGRALEQTGDIDGAFVAFQRGNRLKRSQTDFSIEAERDNVRRIISSFPESIFADREATGCPSELPVFVVGMPRSGTTLTEQILDSHPDVHGAGEINDLWRILGCLVEWLPPGRSLPEAAAEVPSEAWTALGEQVVAKMRGYAPTAERIVDKLPFNYTLLGLIRLMLPEARIVHCVRDPLDTCVSCFTTHFGRDRGFTRDLAELGETYRLYRTLMAHWDQVLPNPPYALRYEHLVADLETEARRLIDYLGLPWSDACLDFHRNTRAVTTASTNQVRQPVYSRSVGRWKPYAAHLVPLIQALGEELAGAATGGHPAGS